MRPVVALLTDFGTTDPFVGIMKGVILSGCPDAQIVDLTHDVPPQAVAEGAFWLAHSAPWLPAGTVVVAVVDPGVGTARRGIVVRSRGRLFVGPDNGLLAPAVSGDADVVVHEIDLAHLGLPVPSRTFHGRDVFARVAADLAAGRLVPADVGPRLAGLDAGAVSLVELGARRAVGTIVTIDRFGNLITDVVVAALAFGPVAVELAGRVLPLRGTYADVGPGEPLALVNAFGVVEIAVRDGSAATALGVGRGERVVVRDGSGPADPA